LRRAVSISNSQQIAGQGFFFPLRSAIQTHIS
jgi:hypothetical protein